MTEPSQKAHTTLFCRKKEKLANYFYFFSPSGRGGIINSKSAYMCHLDMPGLPKISHNNANVKCFSPDSSQDSELSLSRMNRYIQ